MSKVVIIGAGAMGTAFAVPCIDNNHDTNIVGTHLENNFIDDLVKNKRLHPGLNAIIPQGINLIKYENFDSILDLNVDLIVLGISSKGIEWVAEQLSRVYSNKKLPNALALEAHRYGYGCIPSENAWCMTKLQKYLGSIAAEIRVFLDVA